VSNKLTGQLRSAMDRARKQALEEHGVKANHQVPLDAIVLAGMQPRRYFDRDAMRKLTESVRQHGILQPLLVRPHGGGFELIAGERRYRAAKEVGLATVPVAVREMSDGEAREFALLENLQREDLNPVEETEGILLLLCARLDLGVQDVISLLHKMQNEVRGKVTHNVMGNEGEVVIETFERLGTMTWESFVKNRLPLLRLPEDVLKAIREGRLAYTKAVVIARVKSPAERKALLEQAIAGSLSLAELRERIKNSESREETSLQFDFTRRLSSLTRQLRKSNLLENSSKRERAEQLLRELEGLLAEL
jgi:ParB family transcriptional regulator, chromosome partitioning protein